MCLELVLYPSGRRGGGGGLRHRSSEDGASVWPNDGITVTFGLVSCLRQRQPRHAVAKTTDLCHVLLSGRERYRLVRLLSYWTYMYTLRPDCDVPVDIVSSVIWSAAGFGLQTNPLPPLRC